MIAIDGSLRRRLLTWLAALMLGGGSLLLIDAYVNAERAADRAFDGALDDATLTIAEAIQWQEGHPTIAMPAAALQILATAYQERVFYTLLGANDEVITTNAPLPISAAMYRAARKAPLYANIDFHGVPLRLAGREIDSAGWETREPVQIWVAHTRTGRQALMDALFERAALRFMVMAILAGALVWLAVHTSLAPLHHLRRMLKARPAGDLRPLSATVPAELGELAVTLDQLLARQRDSHDRLLRFIADASHQLKTPLAGLQSTSELALRSDSPGQWRRALVDVHDGARRSTRLAHQLLNLARLDHAEVDALEPLDLTALARERMIEWAERLASAAHDLGLDVPDRPVWIQGNAWQLGELINNALDNALRYTPAGTRITLGVRTVPAITLFIEDNGPGVDTLLLTRLTAPFERGGRQDTDGSGLGLTIAVSIAAHHHGEFVLQHATPSGLCVMLRFPPGAEITP